MASKFQMSHVEMTLAMIKPDAEKVRDRIYMATKACTPVSLYFFLFVSAPHVHTQHSTHARSVSTCACIGDTTLPLRSGSINKEMNARMREY